MTDFRFDLKAVRVKRVLAMFMAVCLTVLSVNVDVFATNSDKVVVPSEKTIGYKGGAGEFDFKVTELDGDLLSPLSGDLKVEFGESEIIDFGKNDTITVSVLNGQIDETISVNFAENTKPEKRTEQVSLTFKDAVTGDVITFTEAPVVLEVVQEGRPFEPTTDLKGDLKDEYTTSLNGDVTKYDGTSKSISEANLADDNYVNGLEYADKTEGIVKVTFYNGIATTKNKYGTEVAYATRAKDGKMDARAKADTLIALETAYNQGKEFTGYDVRLITKNKKGKVISDNQVSANVAYKDIPCNDNYVAVAVYKDKNVENGNTEASISVSINQTATLQVAHDDYTKDSKTDKSVKYTATYQQITAGETVTYKNTSVSAGQVIGVSQNKLATQIIKSVKYDAKSEIFTVNAGKKITAVGVPTQVVINRVVAKKDVDHKKVPDVITKVATINVAVEKTVAKPAEITLEGLYGETYANVDYTTNNKQVIKVVANVTGSNALTKDVKFIAVNSVISGLTSAKVTYNTKKELQTAIKASKVAKVDGKGNITVKSKGTAVVYAYTQAKVGDKYELLLSNPFNVTVTKSTATFSVVKNQKFWYNNAIKKTTKTAAVSANAYVVTKGKQAKLDPATGNYTQRVNFTVKVKDKVNDFVAVKVLNKEGKVVLGGVTKVKVRKRVKDSQGNISYVYNDKSEFDYQVNLKAGNAYTSADDLVIVGTAPNGSQKVANLTFALRK